MEKQLAIKVENVSKKYTLGQRGYRTLREDIFRLFTHKKKGQEDSDFYALKDVSFQLKKGEILGIIGPNGAGKSTILKLLSGITLPTKGYVHKEGKIAAMIELAAGFHPELTGRENIYLYGSIMGMKNKEIDKRFKQIVDFSEIGEFLDTPLKRYSSGMKARLGFSVSSHIDADILLIDEVLSVGDFGFQEKCIAKMEEYRNKGVTIIFVSHNLDSIRKLCKRTLLLKKGSVVVDGGTTEAIDRYFDIISEEKKNFLFTDKEGSRKELVKISDARLFDAEGRLTTHFNPGDTASFRYKAIFRGDAKVYFNFVVFRNDRLYVYDSSQYLLRKQYIEAKAGTCVTVEFKFKVNLLKGIYHIGTHVTDFEKNIYHDVIDNATFLFVSENFSYAGVADLNANIEVTGIDDDKVLLRQKENTNEHLP